MQGFSIDLTHVGSEGRRLWRTLARTGRRSAVLGAVLLIVSAATVWATANTPARWTSVTVSPSVLNEGQSVVLSGAFTDPDVGDFHTIQIHWATSQVFAEVIQLPPGQFSFQVSHTFPDDNASSTDVKHITASLYDRKTPPGGSPNDNAQSRATDFRELPIQVNNVPPHILLPSIRLVKTPLDETVRVTIDGDWTDPGADDGIVSFISGDGATTFCSRANRHFHCEHEYHLPDPLRSKVYPITVKVADGDGGLDQYQSSVRIP